MKQRWNFKNGGYEIKVDDGRLRIYEGCFHAIRLEYTTDNNYYKEDISFDKGQIFSRHMHTRSYSGEIFPNPRIDGKVLSILDANGLPEKFKGLLNLVVGKIS